ncbi:MAG: TolC family protein [Gammaproteobacteria bacterium]
MRAPLFIFLIILSCGGALAADDEHLTRCDGESSSPSAPPAQLTLSAAVRAALARHPDLRIADCEIAASSGRRVQAGLRPNPVANLAVENFAGSDTRRGLNTAETTLQLSQLIELGGKRARRTALADAERELAEWDREARRLAVITRTRTAYIDVLAAQARLALAQDLAALARSVFDTVAAKVRAGKVSPVEESRAEVDVQRAGIGVATATNALLAARQQLALGWGGDGATLGTAQGDLSRLPAHPTLAALLAHLDRNPALARWPSELARRRRALELAAANGVQNLTLSGGVRQFTETDDVGIVVGVSVPLPLFDRNQGAILAAQADMAAADAGLDSARRRLLDRIYEQHQALQSAVAEEATLRDQVLPLAQRIFTATSEGYAYGKFGLIEVLDAQRTLFESRALHVDALARYHRAAAEIEGAIGVGLEEAAGPPPVDAAATSAASVNSSKEQP